MLIDIRDKLSKTGKIILNKVAGRIIDFGIILNKTGYSFDKIHSAIERLLRKSYLRKVLISNGEDFFCYRKVLPWEVVGTEYAFKKSMRETFRDVFSYMIRQKVYNVNGLIYSVFDNGMIVLFCDKDIDIKNCDDISCRIKEFFRSNRWLKEQE